MNLATLGAMFHANLLIIKIQITPNLISVFFCPAFLAANSIVRLPSAKPTVTNKTDFKLTTTVNTLPSL